MSKQTAPPQLDPADLPRHLAIIMDGNGRWAKKRGWRRVKGHEEGAESVRVAVRTCRRLGIPALTLYAFSNENWARPDYEVSALMKLLTRFLKAERQEMLDQGIRLNTIGETQRLPDEVKNLLLSTIADTAQGTGMVLTLALSYGSRQEILRAVAVAMQQAAQNGLDPAQMDEARFSSLLFTHDLPDPDLIIRTSGEQRLSNFLLWQAAYSEFYFTPVLWPEFREQELMDALESFADRERRFGKTGEQIKGETN